MSIARNTPNLDAAAASEAYEWLSENRPDFASAIEAEVRRGVSSNQIFYRLLELIGVDRRALAVRCKLAADHLANRKEE